MAARDVPEPWARALVKAGLVDPRYTDDRPSMSRLAEEVHVHPTTISAMMYGERKARPELVTAVAEALGVDPREVSQWVGQARSERDPFKPHPDADLLDQDERNAVNELIRVMAKVKRTGSTTVTPIGRPARRPAGGLAGRKTEQNMQVQETAARKDPPPKKDE